MANTKVLATAAFTAALAGGAAAGILGFPANSSAQTGDTTSTTIDDGTDSGSSGDGYGVRFHGPPPGLAVAAEALGITEDELRTALEDGSSIADVATEQGVDIQTVIDAIVADATANIEEMVTDLVNREGGFAGPGSAGPGFGGPGGHPGLRLPFIDLDVAAEALGLEDDDALFDAFRDGSTIADVAEAQGVDLQTVIDALVADATAEIDEQVAAGDLEADVAEELKADLVDRVTAFVNNAGQFGGPGFGPGPGGFRPGG